MGGGGSQNPPKRGRGRLNCSGNPRVVERNQTKKYAMGGVWGFPGTAHVFI